jgi:hypothetical protein
MMTRVLGQRTRNATILVVLTMYEQIHGVKRVGIQLHLIIMASPWELHVLRAADE